MTNDLISREDLRKAFHERIYYFDKSSWDEANALIDNAPTVDLKDIYQEGHYDGHLEGYTKAINEKRPQGEWVLKEEDCDDGGNNLYECTNCHYSDVHAGSAEVPYCWHCGAEMRKGGAE